VKQHKIFNDFKKEHMCCKKKKLMKINGKLKIFRSEVTNHLDGQVGICLTVYSTECVDEEKHFSVESQVPMYNNCMFSSSLMAGICK